MEFFFVIAQNHLLVTLLKSLQHLPNIASFLDPCGFFVSFHAVFIKAFSCWRPTMNRGDNSDCGLYMAKISVNFGIPQK